MIICPRDDPASDIGCRCVLARIRLAHAETTAEVALAAAETATARAAFDDSTQQRGNRLALDQTESALAAARKKLGK